ncbi:MAG: carboxypeptidase regulatory-like domain-containing protein [Terriglobales bacterium]
MRSTLKLCVLAMMMAITATFAVGQITTSIIVGTVTDASGAAIPSAEVTALNTATDFSRTAATNAEGEYRIDFLPVGNYTVTVSSPGFKKVARTGVVLTVAGTTRVDTQLQVGQVNQTVEVSTEVPLINTTNPEIGRTIETAEIENLPVVNRNVYTLLSITPGVQSNSAAGGGSSIVLGYPEERVFINGGVDVGAGSVNYYLDGGNNMTGIRNTGNLLPNPDAIQEFRVQTNNYNAQYGRFQNGIVNVLTKSGTNGIHGSAFEFVRNTIFDANDWGSTLATPSLHRNQFGGTVGGPIVKDKTFFFFSYGGLRQNTSTFEHSAIIPSAAELGGNFSGAAGGIIPVNPATGKPFANNTIPIDPVALAIIQQNIPAASNAPGGLFQAFVPNPYNTDEFLGKIDENLSDTQRLTLSYFETSGNNSIVPSGSNLPWSLQEFNWRQHNANVSDTWTISPTLINQVWLTYTRNFGGRLNTPGTSLASFGSAFTPDGPPSLPDISVSNFFRLADAIDGPVTGTNFYSVRDVVNWNHGRHSISFGAEESLDKDIQEALLNNYGVFQFNGSATTPKGVKSCPDCPLADFELGIPSKIQQDAPSYGFTNSWYSGFFVQDDFRLKPRFTLNLGLRWDIQTPPTDPQNKESTFVPGVQSTVRPSAPAGILFPGDPGITRGIVPVRWNHISPRIGFAFDPFGNGKTSIRAGAGLFWGSVSGNEWNSTANFEPFAIRINPFPNVSKTGNGATLDNPYKGYVGGDPFPYSGQFVNGATIFGPATNFQWPYTYQFNASVQQQLTNSLSIEVAYVGSLSHDEPFGTDVNYPLASTSLAPIPSSSNFGLRRPDQSFGTIFSLRSNQTASYNGLQVSAVERLSHHLSFNAWYTWSHTFDSVQLDNNTAQGLVEDFNNFQLDRGPGDFDLRHQAVISLIYQPDYYSGENRLIRNTANGWSIAPIFSIHTGIPFSVTNNNIDANLDGNTNDRAALVGDPGLSHPNVGEWFNTAAFAQIPATTGKIVDGSSPRNYLRAPGFRNVDLAVFRTFGLTERFKLEFRAEGQNVLNIANYNSPVNTVGSKTFGEILAATGNGTGTMRELQLGLRLTF